MKQRVNKVLSGRRPNTKIIVVILLIVIVSGITGFLIGSHVQKKHDQKLIRKYQLRLPTLTSIGKVTDLSDKKITIENRLSHEKETFNITSSTEIIKTAKKIELKEIKQDQTVLITPSKDKPEDAKRINLLSPTKSLVPAPKNN